MSDTRGGATPQTDVSSQGQDTKKRKAAGAVTLRLALGVLVSLVASFVFARVWDLVKDRSGKTTAFDDALLRWMHGHQAPALTVLAKVLAFMGSPPTIVGIAVAGTVAGIVWRKMRGAAWTLPIAVIGAGIIIQAVSLEFRRPRPTLFHPLLHETGYSFPSGHSLISIVIYGLLGYFVMHLFQKHTARILVGTVTVLLIVLIGLSRVYVGVHFPTDVLAGWTGGLPWLITCLAIHEHLTRRFQGAGEPILHNPPSLGKAASAVSHRAT